MLCELLMPAMGLLLWGTKPSQREHFSQSAKEALTAS